MEFYVCKHCGNIVAMVQNSGAPVSCCGEKMDRLTENTVDASNEKHLPVVSRSGEKVTVKVGSIVHPMENAHYIGWIVLQTKAGNQRKILQAGAAPEADFYIAPEDEVLKAYAYCNLHGLWSTVL